MISKFFLFTGITFLMIKEKYTQLCLAYQNRGINTVRFTQSLYTIK